MDTPEPHGPVIGTWDGPRVVPEGSHVRTDGSVDVDRLLYSDGFRRLSGVTQVVTPRDEVVQHDRLTHSLKVGQVARRMATHLRRETGAPVDPDTVYAAALAHDVGHPPFGHAGEQELQAVLDGRPGPGPAGDAPDDSFVLEDSFEGNAQTFRLLARLSLRKPGDRAGLNWTLRSLGAVSKYPWQRGGHSRPSLADKWGAYRSEADLLDRTIDESKRLGLWTGERSLEADVVDWSDDIAYAVHDIEDFFRATSIPLAQLRFDDEEWGTHLQFVADRTAYKGWTYDELEQAGRDVRGQLPTSPFRGSERDRNEIRTFAVAMTRLLTQGLTVADTGLVVPVGNQMAAEILKRLVWRYVIHRSDVAMMQRGQRRLVRELVTELRAMLAEHRHDLDGFAVALPPRLVSYARHALESEELAHYDSDEQRLTRATVDFVCSLTDRQAFLLGQRLTGETAGGLGHDWLTV